MTQRQLRLKYRREFAFYCSVTLCAVCASLLLTAGTVGEEKIADARWISLFNGRDLDGWRVKITGHDLDDNFARTFRVEDGLLKVRYDGYENFDGQFGHLFHKESFSNYRLRVEYRFVGDQAPEGPGWAFRNSGVMIHGQTPESMAIDQEFPVSIEVQLLGGRSTGRRSTGNLCTPGTHVVMNGKLITRHCIDSSSKTYRGDQWVRAEVVVRGNKISHIVEGETVLVYTDPQLDEGDQAARNLIKAAGHKLLTGGTISIQSESHPIEFRGIELLELAD